MIFGFTTLVCDDVVAVPRVRVQLFYSDSDKVLIV